LYKREGDREREMDMRGRKFRKGVGEGGKERGGM
jgi:hypothetical protein